MPVIEAPQQRRASFAVLAGGLHLADSAAADETQNQGKQNRTHDGDHNADEHALLSGAGHLKRQCLLSGARVGASCELRAMAGFHGKVTGAPSG